MGDEGQLPPTTESGVTGSICGSYGWLALLLVSSVLALLVCGRALLHFRWEAVVGGAAGMLIGTARLRSQMMVIVYDDRLVYSMRGRPYLETPWAEVADIERHRFHASLVFKAPQTAGLFVVQKRGFVYVDPSWPDRRVSKAVMARVELQQERDRAAAVAEQP